MQNLRIFLTSDIHLGLKFGGYPEVQKELADARFETLQRCVEKANQEKCHILAVGGDMFDKVTVAKRDVIRAADILSEFQGNVVLVLPGNHDYISLGQDDLWNSFEQSAGDNILILKKMQIYPLDHYDLDVNVYPAPCDSKHSSENHIAWIEQIPKDSNIKYHVGLAHGSLEGLSPDFNQDYFPMTKTELHQAGLDIWLMGHTHIQYPDKSDARDKVFYPATPEPDGFDCRHEGKALILELNEDKKIKAHSLSTGQYRYYHDEVKVKTWKDVEMLQTKYESVEHSKTLLKIKLTGRLPEEDYGKLPKVRENLERNLTYLHFDASEMTIKINKDVINRQFTQGSFPHQLLSKLESSKDSDTLQEAYEIIKGIRG